MNDPCIAEPTPDVPNKLASALGKALNKRAAQFETLLSDAPLGVFVVDGDFRIRQVNRIALQFFGGISDLIGRDLDDAIHILWPKASADEIVARFRHTLDTGEPYIDSDLIGERRDRGVTEHYEWQVNRIPLPEDRHGVVCYFRDTSEHILAQQKIRESEERLHLALAAADMGTWRADLTTGLRTRDANFNRILGLAPLPTTQPIDDCFRLILPEDKAAAIAAWKNALEQGSAYDIAFRIRRDDGSIRWLAEKGKVVTDANGKQTNVSGVTLDITERKRAEEALGVSEIRYRRLFESAKDGILILDAHTAKITDANPYIGKLLGYSHTELIGKELWELGLFKDVGASQTAMRELQEKHYIRYEDLALKTKVGRRIDVEFVSNVYSEDQHRVIQCNIRDVSERHRTAEHLAEEDRRKDEFMAMLAHELRNPLTPIKSAAQVLRMAKVDNPMVVRAQEIIERQANHMVRLVDDLLDISRLQMGKVRLKKETLNLTKAVSDAVDSCNALITSHNHQITLNLQGEPPLLIEADPARVVQIVANIVFNAAKYTPNNGVIQVTTVAENGMAVVRVRDNGAGIAPEMLGRIFDVYTQVEQSLDRSQGGLGLGLKLVKELVLLHGGSVKAFSEGLGKGSEFIVRIPLTRDLVLSAEAPPKQPAVRGVCRRVLLVEDSADIRESMEMLLMMNGHKIDTAQDGFQGVDKALTTLPEVVLIDIGLPVLNGYEVAKAIRAGPGGDKIVLIALTGYGQAEDKQHAFEAGFDDHMTKPPDAYDLFAILNDLERYHRVPS